MALSLEFWSSSAGLIRFGIVFRLRSAKSAGPSYTGVPTDPFGQEPRNGACTESNVGSSDRSGRGVAHSANRAAEVALYVPRAVS